MPPCGPGDRRMDERCMLHAGACQIDCAVFAGRWRLGCFRCEALACVRHSCV